MNAVVVDTDVVSLAFKGDSRAEKYLSALAAPDLVFRSWPKPNWNAGFSRPKWGAERIIRFRIYRKRFVSVPSSRDFIVKWAEVRGNVTLSGSGGLKLPTPAATALLYDAPLVINNPGDYVGVTGIKLPTND